MSPDLGDLVRSQHTPETGTCYLLRVSTGCTCCSDMNFIEGPFRNKAEADDRATYHERNRTLSSQYAENGHQYVFDIPYEIGGEWIILDGQYAVKGPFLDDPLNERFDWQLDMFGRDYRM